jgi:hypothetical protein
VTEPNQVPGPSDPPLRIFSLIPVPKGKRRRPLQPVAPPQSPEPGPAIDAQRRHRVLEEYLSIAWDFRRAHRLGNGFDRRVLHAFQHAVTQSYWQTLLAHLRRTHQAQPEAIGRLLHMNRATVWRWFKRKSAPELGNFLGLLTAFDVDVGQVGFPRGRDAMNHGRCEAVTYIRSREWPKERSCLPLTHEESELLHYLCLSRAWADAQTRSDPDSREAAAAEILIQVRRRVPSAPTRNGAQMQDLLHRWFIPWCLFSTVPLYDGPC